MVLQIDHIDNNKQKDWIINLQLLTHRENTSKGYRNKKTSSRFTGVHWHKKDKKWEANIRINNIPKYLGSFNNEIEASNKYQKAFRNNGKN